MATSQTNNHIRMPRTLIHPPCLEQQPDLMHVAPYEEYRGAKPSQPARRTRIQWIRIHGGGFPSTPRYDPDNPPDLGHQCPQFQIDPVVEALSISLEMAIMDTLSERTPQNSGLAHDATAFLLEQFGIEVVVNKVWSGFSKSHIDRLNIPYDEAKQLYSYVRAMYGLAYDLTQPPPRSLVIDQYGDIFQTMSFEFPPPFSGHTKSDPDAGTCHGQEKGLQYWCLVSRYATPA
jgi:hypothetical protein